mmetsp:Transcript_8702/g.21085  ORF Transcript_8702/g.21085 Transcript_8702/m.21085 type:complete len:282 (+) Transcript_8702:846-1691(+)
MSSLLPPAACAVVVCGKPPSIILELLALALAHALVVGAAALSPIPSNIASSSPLEICCALGPPAPNGSTASATLPPPKSATQLSFEPLLSPDEDSPPAEVSCVSIARKSTTFASASSAFFSCSWAVVAAAKGAPLAVFLAFAAPARCTTGAVRGPTAFVRNFCISSAASSASCFFELLEDVVAAPPAVVLDAADAPPPPCTPSSRGEKCFSTDPVTLPAATPRFFSTAFSSAVFSTAGFIPMVVRIVLLSVFSIVPAAVAASACSFSSFFDSTRFSTATGL